MTKFAALDIMYQSSRFKKTYESSSKMDFKYLKVAKKEVTRTVIDFEPTFTSCFSGSDKQIELKFANDKMYAIVWTEYFNIDSYSTMKSDYESLKMMLRDNFNYEIEFETRRESQQVGKGWSFTKQQIIDASGEKLQISYSSEKKKSNIRFDYSEKDVYLVTIEYLDFRGCDLDRRGY